MKKGFTLAELLITIVILAVLTAIALPKFDKGLEREKWAKVVASLRLIRAGERTYFLKNGRYWQCSPPNLCQKDPVRNTLGVEVPLNDYNLSLYTGSNPASFNATISSRANGGARISIFQSGSFSWGPQIPSYVNQPND